MFLLWPHVCFTEEDIFYHNLLNLVPYQTSPQKDKLTQLAYIAPQGDIIISGNLAEVLSLQQSQTNCYIE